MAARDIWPIRSAGGGPGGTVKVETYHLYTDQTFHEGEIVALGAATGQLVLAAHDPDVSDHTDAAGAVGIAAEPAEGMAADAAGVTNPAYANRGVWIFTSEQEWITPNYSTDDGQAWSAVAPLHANIGDPVGLSIIATVHGISSGTGFTQFRVTDILDANMNPIRDQATVGTYTVFRLNTAYAPGLPA